MRVLYKSARVYGMPTSARAPRLSWPSDINYMSCLFNTNLAFMRGGKKKKVDVGSKTKARTRGWELYFLYPSSCIIAFVSTVLASCFVLPWIRLSIACRALYITNRDERTNVQWVSRERLAYPKIIDHTNSREDTWPDLPRYLVLSLMIFPEPVSSQSSTRRIPGSRTGLANKIICIGPGNYLTNSSAYRAIKRHGRPDADAISSTFSLLSLSRVGA